MGIRDAAPGASLPAGDQSGLFLRKSSGLVRDMGLRGAVGVSAGTLCLINVWVFSSFQVSFPNLDFYLPLVGGALISLVLCLAYSQLVGTFARAGGEYVYASRVFSPFFGAMVGGAVLIAVILNATFSAVGISQISAPFMFTTLGQVLHIHALVTFGSSTVVSKTGYLLLALAVVVAYVAFSMRSFKTAVNAIFYSFLVGMAAFVVLVLALLFETRAGFVNAFNHASGGRDAYAQIITQAAKGGFHPGTSLSGAIVGIPVGFLIFEGFTFANYAAGEIKRPLRTYKTSVVVVLGIALLATLVFWTAVRHVAGLQFLQSAGALQGSDPTEYAKLTTVPQSSGALSYAILATGDPVTGVLIAVGAVLGFFANGLVFFLMISRITFALSFDRLLPSKLAEVDERTHSPVYAIALAAVGVLVFTVLDTETTLLSVLSNLLLIVTAIFVIGSAAAAALPYRRKDLYDASPKAFQGSVLGIPLITIVAGLSMLGCTFVDVELATHKAYTGGYTTSSIITLVVLCTLGAVMYVVASASLRRRGIDLKMAMQELPPE